MPTTTSILADEDWSKLEVVLEAFTAAWNDSTLPPAIREYLESEDANLHHLLTIELVKIDLEQRWQRGLQRVIEDYFEDLPELRAQINTQLILEEFHARKLAGDDVDVRELCGRFPDFVSSLERLVAVDPMLQSTLLTALIAQPVELLPGESVDDFDLLLILGKGAFATVFLARQRSMQRMVAVKISAEKGTEPQTLAQLDHNNIIRVYDQKSLPDQELRLLYMQYAAGGTLASVLQTLRASERHAWNGALFLKAIDEALDSKGESPPMESTARRKLAEMTWPAVVCWIGSQLSQALAYAHRLGVLHRDLKPANVLLTAEGVPKLADFNISFSSSVEGDSPVAYFGGSLAYMSPEQLEVCDPGHPRTAESLDQRSDLYSLGVMLWELLSGEHPFQRHKKQDAFAPVVQRLFESRKLGPNPIRFGPSEDSLGLPEILRRCLEPRAENRFLSGTELSHQLELCLQPAAKELLTIPKLGWRHWARQLPLFTVVTLTLIPNLIAAVFNFLYNRSVIVEYLPTAVPTFMRIQSIINLIAFPTGIASAYWLARSVAEATRLNSDRLSADEWAKQRLRCLDLGNLAAMVGLTLWLIAAPAYPVLLHLLEGSVPVQLYIHFVASLAICGLIAAAYPFFGVALVAVRSFYPTLIDRQSMSATDMKSLQRLSRQCWNYLVIAASVPMVGIAIMVIGEPNKRTPLLVLAIGGIFGYGIAVSTFRLVLADIAVLMKTFWSEKN